MAYFHIAEDLSQSTDKAFKDLHEPGTQTPVSGLYRCLGCGGEVVSKQGYLLPPQSHHSHAQGQAVQWQLVVAVHVPSTSSWPD